MRTRQRADLPIEVDQAVTDELDTPVGTRQRVQDVGVEHEHAPHPSGLAQGVVQRGVILYA
jgi:hypothetical protein